MNQGIGQGGDACLAEANQDKKNQGKDKTAAEGEKDKQNPKDKGAEQKDSAPMRCFADSGKGKTANERSGTKTGHHQAITTRTLIENITGKNRHQGDIGDAE